MLEAAGCGCQVVGDEESTGRVVPIFSELELR
jgi:hypothetical protein